jgi:hypothetical protein
MLPGTTTPGTPGSSTTPGTSTPSTPAAGTGGAAAPPVTNPPIAGSPAVMDPGVGTGGTMAPMTPATPAGPEDGDPNAPVFTIPDVACGGPQGGFGLGSPNFMMDSREVIVTYPCNKHAGAPMTFFLNLHGTTPVEQHFYQHGYFKIHQFAQTHNIIVLTPSSVVQQWGNMDGGEDLPHLMNLINWVYATFHGEGKLDIRAMWVGGHSWGAMYSTTFVCNADLADKIKGGVFMSGIGRAPACADKISGIMTVAENDISSMMNQGTAPTTHGCEASMESMIGNNVETYWPGCNPGFAHANYFMLGKMHASAIDVDVVQRIADLIKATRQ